MRGIAPPPVPLGRNQKVGWQAGGSQQADEPRKQSIAHRGNSKSIELGCCASGLSAVGKGRHRAGSVTRGSGGSPGATPRLLVTPRPGVRRGSIEPGTESTPRARCTSPLHRVRVRARAKVRARFAISRCRHPITTVHPITRGGEVLLRVSLRGSARPPVHPSTPPRCLSPAVACQGSGSGEAHH